MRTVALLLSLIITGTAMAQPGKTLAPAAGHSTPAKSKTAAAREGKFVLVVHGGAGTILKSQMTPEKERAYQAGLDAALGAGSAILENGGTAVDAVEAAVRVLEDNPLFNAGKGAVFTNAGRNELDAAIMDGSTLKAGSIAGVTTIRNPISTAREVMDSSEHVLLTGKGAEEFAAAHGKEMVDPAYFYTEARWQGLLKARAEDSLAGKFPANSTTVPNPAPVQSNRPLPQGSPSFDNRRGPDTATDGQLHNEAAMGPRRPDAHGQALPQSSSGLKQPSNRDYKYGTVGAVALDRQGNLAAATSTGGMTNKRYGRVGDAPIIGAGTYANNKTVAISCTGWGEYYIRLVLAKTISDMMEYGKIGLQTAATEMVMKKLPALGGDGGLIAVDRQGNIAMPFCTEGMYRGYVREGEKKVVQIYKQ